MRVVKMLEDRPVTTDGVRTIDALTGESYEMGDGVAETLVAQGAAEYDGHAPATPEPELEAKVEPGADETQDAGHQVDDGAAPVKKPRTRKKDA